MTQSPLQRRIEKAKAANSSKLPGLLAFQEAQQKLSQVMKDLAKEYSLKGLFGDSLIREQEEAIAEFEQETGKPLTDTEKMLLSKHLGVSHFPLVWPKDKSV